MARSEITLEREAGFDVGFAMEVRRDQLKIDVNLNGTIFTAFIA